MVVQDLKRRSFVKAISYRIYSSLISSVLLFMMTGSPVLSISFGAMEMMVKVLTYFLYERVWDKIPFGRRKPPEYSI